ncbi:MAG: glycosyltransferase family 2 protein [Dorea sp.]|jgi:glycosyltransferase involved in cell wall biosynthesis|nr:glycosyltransferase family 2 protein [Dorea sp.]
MNIEAKLNYQLNKYPAVKKVIKRVYQRTMYTVSPKIKSEGNIIRISPKDPKHEYFFGYYDKSPWDVTDRYMLCMKAKDTWSDVSPRETAQIILIDTKQDNKTAVLAETHSWNVQQGCMLQWLGPEFKDRVLFNDCRDGKYCSVILKLEFPKDSNLDGLQVTEEKVIPAPVYSVAADGTFALTLDFSRLYRLRPGYGYYNVREETAGEKLPDKPCIWRVDLVSGEVKPVLKYSDFASFLPRPEMEGAEHKVNHIMLSPNGKRFMVLYRWFAGQRKYTRLVTCNVDGTDMYVLSDDDMVSHCCWRNDKQIFAYENKKHSLKGDKAGSGYYLMKDKTHEYRRFWPGIDYDGHPSYSPDCSRVVFDRYPNRARIASVMVSNAKNRKDSGVKVAARVFAPFKYDNDTRCDLHPRWNRRGDKICFDSVFEGHRGLYVVAAPDSRKDNPLISVIVPVYNVEKYLKRCVASILEQTYENLEIILVDDGSSDHSGKICDDISKLDVRVKVVHKENGGLSSARNVGLEEASGDFLTFVDSDDWLDENIYQTCINTFEKYGCDVVDFKTLLTERKKSQKSSVGGKPIIIENESILYDYLYRGQTEKCPFSACRKVYRRALYDDIRFPVGKVNEDIATTFKALSKAGKLIHIEDVGYYYFQNPQSITNGELRKRDFDLLDASEELCKLSIGCRDKRIHQLAEIKLARSYFSLLAKAAVGGFAADIENPKKCARELTVNLRRNYRKLMSAPIPVNRKVLITFMAFDYRCIGIPAKIFKRLKYVCCKR